MKAIFVIFLIISVCLNTYFVFAFATNRVESNEQSTDLSQQVNWQLFDCQYSETDLIQQVKQTTLTQCKRKCEQMSDRCSQIFWSNGNCLLKFGKFLKQIDVEVDKQTMLGVCAYKHTKKSFLRSFFRAFKVFILFIFLLLASYFFAEWIDALNKSQFRLKHAHVDAKQLQNQI